MRLNSPSRCVKVTWSHCSATAHEQAGRTVNARLFGRPMTLPRDPPRWRERPRPDPSSLPLSRWPLSSANRPSCSDSRRPYDGPRLRRGQCHAPPRDRARVGDSAPALSSSVSGGCGNRGVRASHATGVNRTDLSEGSFREDGAENYRPESGGGRYDWAWNTRRRRFVQWAGIAPDVGVRSEVTAR